MARDYLGSKRGKMVTIHGFSEMIEMLSELEKRGIDETTEKIFDECTDIIKDSVDKYADDNLPASLASKKTQFKVKNGNIFMYSYGWSRNDPETFLKVCYLNYGTPKRYTKAGQRVMIDGKWVTLGAARGRIQPRGFLSNAKRSASQKINARKKAMLKELLGGGGK